jgi:hypothetical protein
MAYNRYQGNSGRVTRVQDTVPGPDPFGIAPPARTARGDRQPSGRSAGGQQQNVHRTIPKREQKPPAHASKWIGGLSGLLNKLNFANMELEDILLLLILYLMYRESGDEELLIIMGALFLL